MSKLARDAASVSGKAAAPAARTCPLCGELVHDVGLFTVRCVSHPSDCPNGASDKAPRRGTIAWARRQQSSGRFVEARNLRMPHDPWTRMDPFNFTWLDDSAFDDYLIWRTQP